MKRNTLTAWLLGIILIFSATSCFNGPIVKGSKNYITKKENLEHFNDISMSGSANIIYQQDSSSRIEIYGSDNIVELLETKVNGKSVFLSPAAEKLPHGVFKTEQIVFRYVLPLFRRRNQSEKLRTQIFERIHHILLGV